MSTAPTSPQQPEPRQAEPEESTTRDEVRVRRAPKYPVFIFGGIVVGVIATFIAVSTAPGAATDPFAQVFGYFVLYGIAVGALFGAVVAVIFDAIATRRAKSVQTEKTSAVLPEGSGESTRGDATDDDPVDGQIE